MMLIMAKENNKIKCEVESCKYNDEKCCELDEVKIGCNCENDACSCSDETICKSFCEE